MATNNGTLILILACENTKSTLPRPLHVARRTPPTLYLYFADNWKLVMGNASGL